MRVSDDTKALLAMAIKYARREGFWYGAAFGALTVTIMRRILDAVWP